MGEGNGTPLQYSCLENPMVIIINRKTEKQIKPEKQKQKLLKPNTGDTDLNTNMFKTP